MTSLQGQLKYLYHLERFEKIKPGLAVMRALLHELGNPQKAYSTIHISGTNGKGSVAAMLASMLQHASPLIRGARGVRVGRYTSPHLIHFNERVSVNNHPIANPALARLINEVRTAAARAQLEPTFFEFTTALAFLHFAREQVDAAVIEVGMGGDLDATNVITPKLTIITNIGSDHTRWLGTTHHAIAEHKAGIIKPGVPLITAERRPHLLDYFQKICRRNNAPFLPVHQHFRARRISQDLSGQTFFASSYPPDKGGKGGSTKNSPLMKGGQGGSSQHSHLSAEALAKADHLSIPLLGGHQIDNALTALLAFSVFSPSGEGETQRGWLTAAKRGLKNVRWPGRLQIFSQDPFILLDGAHNAPAVRALSRALDELPLPEPGVLLLGSKHDKNINPILKHIIPRFPHIIVTEANFLPMPAAELSNRIIKPLPLRRGGDKEGVVNLAPNIQSIPNLSEALAAAKAQLEPNQMLLITGSLYLVGDALQQLEKS